MSRAAVPKIGMRIVKTAVAVMLSYGVFLPFGLLYQTEFGGVWGQMGPLYACIACIVCIQSTLGQTVRSGLSRLAGVAVGGALSVLTLALGGLPASPWVRLPTLGALCVAGVWICLLIRLPAACAMACIVPCVVLITGVEGADRYYYAAARILETGVGVTVALLVNLALPDHRREPRTEKKEDAMRIALNNHTKKLCVIGDPVLHSKSPLIQNTMIEALGLDYVFLCQSVPRGECARWLSCAKFAGYAGFTATMPHKEALLPLMDELGEDARLLGAVNTVTIRADGTCRGDNTDGAGFLRALADGGIDPAGLRVVVLGAGGAAKAVALKLARAGAARVTICNRTVEKAEALCAHAPGVLRPAGFTPPELAAAAADCALLVNCTSLGMEGTPGQFGDLSFLEALPAGTPVCDLIYAPAQTELLARARALGHPAMNGMGLLVHQAVLALECFTGENIDPQAMKAALAGVLSEKV